MRLTPDQRRLIGDAVDIKKFPEWLKGKTRPYKNWFNHKRYHDGIQNYPAKLYLGT